MQRVESPTGSAYKPNESPGGHGTISTSPAGQEFDEESRNDRPNMDSPDAIASSIQQMFSKQDLFDKNKFKQFVFDDQGQILEDTDDDDAAELQDNIEDGGLGSGKKSEGEQRDKAKNQKKRKGKEIYLDSFVQKSRNLSTMQIRPDPKNNTVGKVISKDRVSKLKKSLGHMASVLKSQFEKDDLYQEPEKESHVMEFNEVDESFSDGSHGEQQQKLYLARQLTFKKDEDEVRLRKGRTVVKSMDKSEVSKTVASEADDVGSEKAQDQLTAQDTEKPVDGMVTEGKTEADGDGDDDDESKKKEDVEEQQEEPDPFQDGPDAYLKK